MGIVINVIHQTFSNTQDGGTIIYYIYIFIYTSFFLEVVEDLFLVGPAGKCTEFSVGDFYLIHVEAGHYTLLQTIDPTFPIETAQQSKDCRIRFFRLEQVWIS